MNKVFRRATTAILATVMVFSFMATAYGLEDASRQTGSVFTAASVQSKLKNLKAPGDPKSVPKSLQIDWEHRYTYAELEDQLRAMAKEVAGISELYSIGTSWQERDLWCLELTNKSIPDDKKTGIGIFANIHGGERESASSAMYTAWWMVLNRGDEYMKTMLKEYIIYIIPVINPDGYEQSFVYNNRTNLRPTDRNENGIPFSDPYTDIDGDGYIATLYRGTANARPETKGVKRFGMESPDWDKNGILGDDPRSSTIDMNRTFNYQWNRYDIETVETGVIGNNSWASAGLDAASEPEIKAIQNFLAQKPMAALTSLHTGIQCVLYPWCYRPYDSANPDDADIPFMKDVAAKMASKYQESTGRGFYTKSSYEDYPTSAEMIDYAYGTFNIHAYTIEVYRGGKSPTGNINDCQWENKLPEEKWTFYSQDALKKMGLDPVKLVGEDGKPLDKNEGLWFYTNSTAQMVDKAPEDQLTLVKGAKDSILVMIESEPYGEGYKAPFFVK